MKTHLRTIQTLFAAAVLAVLAAGAPAHAQDYPSRPVSLVTPFPPGGAADVVIRLMAQELGKEMDATFIVDNRAGAGGAIGTSYVARAHPDGYTCC
ncbi:tripartite tricarboxylate transporter substrate-binding protein [Pigmentiphaga sp. YJ18]|uniref:Bug family tripartite tricarboxylate transporter substrate binding protein n=1 Tax=Pigmentiphaga sp. YJ18 TaxID=3134907 RepID=UPI00310D5E07